MTADNVRQRPPMKKSRIVKLRTPDGTIALPARVWAKIDLFGACWLWTGATSGGSIPYGITWNGQRRVKAHRFVFEAQSGRQIPDELTIDHLCKTTLCVRPSHLEVVTRVENVMRSDAPGPLAMRTNHCKRGHEFTPENTRVKRNDGGRECRHCCRIRGRASKARLRARRTAA